MHVWYFCLNQDLQDGGMTGSGRWILISKHRSSLQRHNPYPILSSFHPVNPGSRLLQRIRIILRYTQIKGNGIAAGGADRKDQQAIC